MDQDIQTLKEHVATLQTAINEGRTHTQASGEVTQKNLATTNADLERVQQELKRVKGDIDALKVGVTMGQMPGQETPTEGSIAAQLGEVKTRLDALEQRVSEMATIAATRSNDRKDSGSVNADLDSMETAYTRKKYKEVVQDAPIALKKLKGKDREKALTIYGESLARLGRHKDAALQFNEILEGKPSESVAAYAKLRVAESFRSMGDRETAKLFFEEVIAKYPNSPEAARAKKAIGAAPKTKKNSQAQKS